METVHLKQSLSPLPGDPTSPAAALNGDVESSSWERGLSQAGSPAGSLDPRPTAHGAGVSEPRGVQSTGQDPETTLRCQPHQPLGWSAPPPQAFLVVVHLGSGCALSAREAGKPGRSIGSDFSLHPTQEETSVSPPPSKAWRPGR